MKDRTDDDIARKEVDNQSFAQPPASHGDSSLKDSDGEVAESKPGPHEIVMTKETPTMGPAKDLKEIDPSATVEKPAAAMGGGNGKPAELKEPNQPGEKDTERAADSLAAHAGQDKAPTPEPDGAKSNIGGNFTVVLTETDPKAIIITPFGIDPPTDDELRLWAGIESTATTLRGMFPDSTSDPRKKKLFDEYITKLFLIARVGLWSSSQPKLGLASLQNFQEGVVSREGARIKNDYMKELGRWALIFSGVALTIYAGVRIGRINGVLGDYYQRFDSFLVLWIGAMIGCWLSFGIRNVELKFTSLGHPESDLLQPNIRLIFTGLLALTLGLTFSVGMAQIQVGGLKTTDITGGSVALIIGLFSGIAEQALSSTIGNRAVQFMGKIDNKQ